LIKQVLIKPIDFLKIEGMIVKRPLFVLVALALLLAACQVQPEPFAVPGPDYAYAANEQGSSISSEPPAQLDTRDNPLIIWAQSDYEWYEDVEMAALLYNGEVVVVSVGDIVGSMTVMGVDCMYTPNRSPFVSGDDPDSPFFYRPGYILRSAVISLEGEITLRGTLSLFRDRGDQYMYEFAINHTTSPETIDLAEKRAMGRIVIHLDQLDDPPLDTEIELTFVAIGIAYGPFCRAPYGLISIPDYN